MQTVRVRLPVRKSEYEIKVGSDLLSEAGGHVRVALGGETRRVAVFSNHKVFALYGKTIQRSLRAADFEVSAWLMKDGEQNKSFRSLEDALKFLSRSGFE